jgi:hypothetical protein
MKAFVWFVIVFASITALMWLIELTADFIGALLIPAIIFGFIKLWKVANG